MNAYHYSVHPPPIVSYQSYHQQQPYLGPSLYQSHSMTPYSMTNGYITPHPSQMYLHNTSPSVYQMPLGGSFGHHQLMAEDPSCFESFLQNICCCFGFGPQSHHDITYKYEMQRRRLMEKEGIERMLQDEKIQKEKQRMLERQQRKQLAMNTAANKITKASISVPKSTAITTTTTTTTS